MTDITTVADDLIVAHHGRHVDRLDGLDTRHRVLQSASTPCGRSSRPPGELLARITTVNDVHFGELEAGRLDDNSAAPVRRVPEGAEPYPEVMNRAAASEMLAVDPDAVIVKGDLSVDGRPGGVGGVRGLLPSTIR